MKDSALTRKGDETDDDDDVGRYDDESTEGDTFDGDAVAKLEASVDILTSVGELRPTCDCVF
jgi:hypothetical protein